LLTTRIDALKAAGIDEVIVYCVNDAAVMTAWAEDQGVEGSMIKFLADPSGAFTDAIDMKMTHPGPPSVGIIGRCKRHALYIEDGIVKAVRISEGPDDPAGDDDPSATLADAMLETVAQAV
jgi:peroxiredoxin 5